MSRARRQLEERKERVSATARAHAKVVGGDDAPKWDATNTLAIWPPSPTSTVAHQLQASRGLLVPHCLHAPRGLHVLLHKPLLWMGNRTIILLWGVGGQDHDQDQPLPPPPPPR